MGAMLEQKVSRTEYLDQLDNAVDVLNFLAITIPELYSQTGNDPAPARGVHLILLSVAGSITEARTHLR